MPYQMEWLHEGRIIFARVWGSLTVEDARTASIEYYQYIEKGIPPIHSIFDVREVTKFPNLLQLRSAMTSSLSPREGWMMIAGGNPALRFIASVLMQLLNYRFRMVETKEEAVAFLTKHDPSLKGVSISSPPPARVE
jgi:hypothetical protein